MEKKVMKMEKILVKLEKLEKMEKILAILEKIIVTIPAVLSPRIDLIHLHAKLEGAYHWLWPVHADVYNLDGLQLAEKLLEI